MLDERAFARDVARAQAADEGRRAWSPHLARGELGRHRARRRWALRPNAVLFAPRGRSSRRPALRPRCSVGCWASAALRGGCSGSCSFVSRRCCSALRSPGCSVCGWASCLRGFCLRSGSGSGCVFLRCSPGFSLRCSSGGSALSGFLRCSPGFSLRCSSGGSALSGSRRASSTWLSSGRWVARLGSGPRSRLLPWRPARPQRQLRREARSASFGLSGVFAPSSSRGDPATAHALPRPQPGPPGLRADCHLRWRRSRGRADRHGGEHARRDARVPLGLLDRVRPVHVRSSSFRSSSSCFHN